MYNRLLIQHVYYYYTNKTLCICHYYATFPHRHNWDWCTCTLMHDHINILFEENCSSINCFETNGMICQFLVDVFMYHCHHLVKFNCHITKLLLSVTLNQSFNGHNVDNWERAILSTLRAPSLYFKVTDGLSFVILFSLCFVSTMFMTEN